MNARSEATLTLEAVAKHFAHWRRRKTNGERIPEEFWNQALTLLETYGISQVSRTLRLSYTELDKRRKISEAGLSRQGSGDDTAFVEIDRALIEQAPGPDATAVWMELERPDGLRLRIRPSHRGDMLTLLDRFMGA
jgi:hypothetical protein